MNSTKSQATFAEARLQVEAMLWMHADDPTMEEAFHVSVPVTVYHDSTCDPLQPLPEEVKSPTSPIKASMEQSNNVLSAWNAVAVA